MNIRRLTPADAVAYQTLRLAGLRYEPTAFASSFEEECDLPMAEVERRLSGANDAAVFGAFDGETLVGMTGLYRETKTKLAHKGVVWGVYVAPEARRLGLGRRLVELALQHAESLEGVRQVVLGVNAKNDAAAALYRDLGFNEYGVERGFMIVDGELQDEIMMMRLLSPGGSPTPA